MSSPARRKPPIDARFLPGHEQELLETLDELIGNGIDREVLVRDIAVETSFDGAVVDTMSEALRSEDSGARPRSLSDERRHRRQVVLHPRHSVLRICAIATAAGAGLHRRCGTESTNGFRSMGFGSACAYSTASFPAAESPGGLS